MVTGHNRPLDQRTGPRDTRASACCQRSQVRCLSALLKEPSTLQPGGAKPTTLATCCCQATNSVGIPRSTWGPLCWDCSIIHERQ